MFFVSGDSQGDCNSNEDYFQTAWAFCLGFIIACCVLALTLFIYDKYKNRNLPRASVRRPSQSESDKIYASIIIGGDSVYQFLLGKSWIGWAIALLTVVAQLWMLYVFVQSGCGGEHNQI